MLRGLKKAFSRGRRGGDDSTQDVECEEEIDHGDDATNSPVMVVSRQQHTDAAGGRGDMAHSAAPPPPGGYRGQPIAPARATNAWSFGNLAVEDDAPASAHTGSASTAATTVPRSPAAHVTASSPSAAAAQPAHSSAAWSAAPGVEKEHKPSKLSALFHRSGSKKAEKVTALGSADVHTHFSDKFREPTEGGATDADDLAASSPSTRSGAARTGSLLATPLAVEDRRGLVM
eukprot:XP_001694926.1 predicted protein [Chlamydomonas reinhardtii]